MSDDDDDPPAWCPVDFFDLETLKSLERDARAAALDARQKAEDFLRSIGRRQDEIQRLADEVEAIAMRQHHATIAQLQRRLAH